MWQAEADTEPTLSASPATPVGQSKLNMAKLEYGRYYVSRSERAFLNFMRHYFQMLDCIDSQAVHATGAVQQNGSLSQTSINRKGSLHQDERAIDMSDRR